MGFLEKGAFVLIKHRNSQRRIYLDNAVYFITFKTYGNFPYFKLPIFCDLFVEELMLCKTIKQFELYAYNVLYDHVHLLLKPRRKYNITKIIKSLKENASRDINYVITGRYNVGDTSTCRLHVRGFINECRKKFVNQYGTNQIHFPPFKWQQSFHDHVIRNEKDFANHYNYVVYNHQKHGLPENWKYTSLKP